MNIRADHDPMRPDAEAPCSFCHSPATGWLLPTDMKFGPDDPFPNLCDACTEVIGWAIGRLPRSTEQWCCVSLDWLLRPVSDEEGAVWAAEDMLGLGPSGEEWR